MAKPKKFLRLLPHLPVKNLRLTLDYYRDKLGFTNEWTFGSIDGGISKDDLHLLFEENENFANDINNRNHHLPIIWFVENIDDIYTDFIERNIELAHDLRTQSYGLREFAFIDINGYFIRIAEEIEEV